MILGDADTPAWMLETQAIAQKDNQAQSNQNI